MVRRVKSSTYRTHADSRIMLTNVNGIIIYFYRGLLSSAESNNLIFIIFNVVVRTRDLNRFSF